MSVHKVKVLFFATLKAQAGTGETTLDIPVDSTVNQFKGLLLEAIPSLEPHMSSALVSVNKEYAFPEEVIPEGAEIALFPPVSGGSKAALPTFFEITEKEIDLNSLLESITLPSTGAAVFFSGMVRAVTQGGVASETEFLEYEAYKPMAEAKMQQVADEIRDKWPEVEGIAVVQRIGRLYPSTPTVLIACTAPHRDSGAFEAARFGIDRLKQIVPVWKKEVGPDGQSWVEGEYLPSPGE
ncbi:MAG: molybdopterin converting factor [Chloroflexi bacterium]|nr:MAG: molybdopterin converting factor [Chloroflexota bacterium]MBL1193560.1 molybdopterin converting factor [Chloroflexota bacterium]NOH10851.1 molybdopterin converting factor [Chloroflexota bacterium]